MSAVRWRTEPDLWERLKPLARQMRTAPTPAEELLWRRLRRQLVGGFKFRRQHPIERFVADFYCTAAKLIVEVDGPAHQYRQEEDQVRLEYLQSLGLRMLRFSNEEVLEKTGQVVTEIAAALSAASLSASGEGPRERSSRSP